jgi:hypothetical protein
MSKTFKINVDSPPVVHHNLALQPLGNLRKPKLAMRPQGGLCLTRKAFSQHPGNLRHPNLAPRPQGGLRLPGGALPQPQGNPTAP